MPTPPSASPGGAVDATVRNDARPPIFLGPGCGSLTHNIGLVVGPNLGPGFVEINWESSLTSRLPSGS